MFTSFVWFVWRKILWVVQEVIRAYLMSCLFLVIMRNKFRFWRAKTHVPVSAFRSIYILLWVYLHLIQLWSFFGRIFFFFFSVVDCLSRHFFCSTSLGPGDFRRLLLSIQLSNDINLEDLAADSASSKSRGLMCEAAAFRDGALWSATGQDLQQLLIRASTSQWYWTGTKGAQSHQCFFCFFLPSSSPGDSHLSVLSCTPAPSSAAVAHLPRGWTRCPLWDGPLPTLAHVEHTQHTHQQGSTSYRQNGGGGGIVLTKLLLLLLLHSSSLHSSSLHSSSSASVFSSTRVISQKWFWSLLGNTLSMKRDESVLGVKFRSELIT